MDATAIPSPKTARINRFLPYWAVFQADALPKLIEAGLRNVALDLDEIGFRQLELGIGDPRLQPAVIGEQEQALAVAVEPPRRIDAGDVDIVRQGRTRRLGAAIGELAQHAIGFVEQDQPRHRRRPTAA